MADATTQTLRQLVAACAAAEAAFADRAGRVDALRRFESLLPSVASLPGLDVPTLRGLADRAATTGDPRQLTALIVPLERALGRALRDEDFLPVTDDAGRERAVMPVELVADSLRSAFNVGGLFRAAECFGAEAVVLSGYSADPGDARVAKAALGTSRLVPWRRAARAADAVAAARGAGRVVVALETSGTAIDNADLGFPCTVLVGNERHGLDSAVVELADRVVRVPMHGSKNSLNVVAASSVFLHELRRRWETDR